MVTFDIYKMLIHDTGNIFLFKRFMLHDMAPTVE